MTMSELREGKTAHNRRSFPSANDESRWRASSLPKVKREGAKREKEVFETVHQELNEKLQLESQKLHELKKSLEGMQISLERKEKAMNRQVQLLTDAALKQKEDRMKEQTTKIISKYEDALDQLGKENKRLQVSLKDMVATNRTLRDQNKKQLAEADEKDLKIEELAGLLKQAKDRHERLKGPVSRPVAASPTPEAGSEDMFVQMKRILALKSARKPATADAAAQTEGVPLAKPATPPPTKPAHSPMKLIHYLLTEAEADAASHFCDAIVTSYEYIMEECCYKPRDALQTIPLYSAVKERYLGIIFKGATALSPYERHSVASLVYTTLSEERMAGRLASWSDRSVVLLYYIPLACIAQPEVVDALLDGLLSHLTASTQSRSLLLEYGIDPLLNILAQTPKRDAASNMVSCILILLLTEGTWLAG
ncbi:hypothetical protein HDV03_002459 [Kappamyces sp. JEL0829]|nr:hypothetical protein HDV03_002459 [Kappamyces sp. JEL0829]